MLGSFTPCAVHTSFLNVLLGMGDGMLGRGRGVEVTSVVYAAAAFTLHTPHVMYYSLPEADSCVIVVE